MNKHTIETIKQTICYKSNIDAIKVIYPDHWHLFAHELMVAANAAEMSWGMDINSRSIAFAFRWLEAPQGLRSWLKLWNTIEAYSQGAK